MVDVGELGTILGIWAHPDHDLAIDLVLDPDTTGLKVRALAAQRSQTAALIGAMGRERYAEWVADEAFVERGRGPR